MPAGEVPRHTHLSAVAETESVPEENEGATPDDARDEILAEEPSEGSAPGEE